MMKALAKKMIMGSGALRALAGVREAGAAILMYHSVLPDPTLYADSIGDIVHSERAFREQMELLARDFHPVSLDNVCEHVRGNRDLPRRAIVVTFDDGYADNYEIAAPMLNQIGLPATFYVTVDCIENQRPPWPSRLRFSFRNTKRNVWVDAENTRPLNNPEGKERAFLAACDSCCQLSGSRQEAYVVRIEQDLDCRLSSQLSPRMMSFENLRDLSRQGHTVGSHTITHPNMAFVGEQDALREFTSSKERLDRQLAAPVRHFAYPCPALSPHWTPQTVALCRASGYESAVTTNSGTARRNNDLFSLKRIHPTKTVEGLRWNLENAFAGRRV